MAITTAIAKQSATILPAKRDGAIDAVRVLSLIAVVILHSLMVGATRGGDGSLQTTVAMSGTEWFIPVSWAFQVMPLFFIAGGFASMTAWLRMRERGGTWQEWVGGRTRRLVVPAAVMVFTVGVLLLIAGPAGLAPELIAEASLRVGQPLWFLAVYIGVTALVPVMAKLHRRFRVLTLATLGAAVVIVDVLALVLAQPLIGAANLVFVWLFIHQLGFFFFDGAGERWRRWQLAGAALVSVGAIFWLIAFAGYSGDMYYNLNPPTVALLLLGISQFFILRLTKPLFSKLMERRPVAHVVNRVNARSMTIYLWHMPLILALVAVMFVSGLPMADLHSGMWWLTRLPWLLAIALVVLIVGKLLAPIESWRPRSLLPDSVRSGWLRNVRGVATVVAGIAGVVIVLLLGFDHTWLVALALALMVVSVAAGNGLKLPVMRSLPAAG